MTMHEIYRGYNYITFAIDDRPPWWKRLVAAALSAMHGGRA